MIVTAAICPSAPLLARDLTGQALLLPELHEAAAAAAAHLVTGQPDVIVITGSADETRAWDAAGRLDLAAYAPALGLHAALDAEPVPALPLALGIGGLLLDAAGYQGPRVYQGIDATAPPSDCLRLGREIAASAPRVGLLAVGDGSARRSAAAPGYLDERAEPFDAAVERAVRDGDLGAIAALDPLLATDLLAAGRAAWQVLAGALLPDGPAAGGLRTQIQYCAAPLGVAYLAATLAPASPAA